MGLIRAYTAFAQRRCRIGLGADTVLHFRMLDAVELEAARHTHALTVRDPLTGVFRFSAM